MANLPLSSLATTDTFRTWFQLTDNIVSLLNTSVVGANVVVYGVFTIGANSNTSFSVSNNFLSNSSGILFTGNTTIAANLSITSNANAVIISANNLTISPLNGTLFGSNVVVNASASFLGPVTANASFSVNGATSVTGTLTLVGNLAQSNGGLSIQQLSFLGNNSVCANTLNNPEYDNFNPTGLSGCQILNLTPNINTVITGLQQPPNITGNGAQVLYIQNLSTTFTITIPSANTNSSVGNRFKLPTDETFILYPGQAMFVIWSFTNQEWRPFSGIPPVGPQTFANTTINGTLLVTGNVTFQSNVSAANVTSNGTITANNLIVLTSASLTNTTISGNTSLGANTTYSAKLQYSGASARLVIPVGTNLWAV